MTLEPLLVELCIRARALGYEIDMDPDIDEPDNMNRMHFRAKRIQDHLPESFGRYRGMREAAPGIIQTRTGHDYSEPESWSEPQVEAVIRDVSRGEQNRYLTETLLHVCRWIGYEIRARDLDAVRDMPVYHSVTMTSGQKPILMADPSRRKVAVWTIRCVASWRQMYDTDAEQLRMDCAAILRDPCQRKDS